MHRIGHGAYRMVRSGGSGHLDGVEKQVVHPPRDDAHAGRGLDRHARKGDVAAAVRVYAVVGVDVVPNDEGALGLNGAEHLAPDAGGVNGYQTVVKVDRKRNGGIAGQVEVGRCEGASAHVVAEQRLSRVQVTPLAAARKRVRLQVDGHGDELALRPDALNHPHGERDSLCADGHGAQLEPRAIVELQGSYKAIPGHDRGPTAVNFQVAGVRNNDGRSEVV